MNWRRTDPKRKLKRKYSLIVTRIRVVFKVGYFLFHFFFVFLDLEGFLVLGRVHVIATLI